MEIPTEFIPFGAIVLIFIGGLIAANKEIAKRPTFKELEDKYTDKKLCDEIHRNVKEKLDCIPEIKKTLTQIATKMGIKED